MSLASPLRSTPSRPTHGNVMDLYIKLFTTFMTFAAVPLITWIWNTNSRLVRVESRDDSDVKARLERLENKIDELTAYLLRRAE